MNSTPIDPREIDTLYATYETSYEKAVGEIPFGISPAQMKGNAIYAVARAVLPEGYVAVPVAEIERLRELVIDAGEALEDDISPWEVVDGLFQPEWECIRALPAEDDR